MKKIVKLFTRDISMAVTQWWHAAQTDNFKRELGIGYNAIISQSNGLTQAYFYLESDVEAVKQAFLSKLKKDPDYYLKQRKQFREHIQYCREMITRLNLERNLDQSIIHEMKNSLIDCFPTYRFTLLAPSAWAEDVRKLDGGKETIAAAFEDREFAEGTVEGIDTVLRSLLVQKLKELDKPLRLAKFLTEEEVNALANGNEVNWQEVEERTHGFVYVNGQVFVSKDYQRVFKERGYLYEEEKPTGSQLKGTVASSGGVVKGKVKLLYSVEQLNEFPKGAILVTPMTVPDFIPAMKMAKAIVTDEGGVTCHAAIVSREMNIPCIIGTKFATKLLKDGDLVEVDTEKGTVKKL